MKVAVAFFVLLVAGAASAQGSVHPLCEEGHAADHQTIEASRRASPPAAILPCAILDSGLLNGGRADSDLAGRDLAGSDLAGSDMGSGWGEAGAQGLACADAPFYIVTHAGVLLCQVDVELFAAAEGPSLERAPSGVLAQSAAHAVGANALPAQLHPPAPQELERVRAQIASSGPQDAATWRPPRPS